MALPNTITLDGLDFERIDARKFILDSSTVDEPYYLTTKSTVKPDGRSSFVIRIDQYLNDASGEADDHLECYIVCRYDTKAFNPGNIGNAIERLRLVGRSNTAGTDPGFLENIMRGEG